MVLVALPDCPGIGAAQAVVAAPPLTRDTEVTGVMLVVLGPAEEFGALFRAAYNKRNKIHMLELTSLKRSHLNTQVLTSLTR